MGSYNILQACVWQCIRQNTTADRVPRLHAAYNYARALSNLKAPLTFDRLMAIAKRIEPDNKGELRKTPVTFRNGSTALDADLLPIAIDNWIEGFNDVIKTGDTSFIDQNAKEFLDIHPFVDGNGRTAWVLYNWLHGSFESPIDLPYFYDEEN